MAKECFFFLRLRRLRIDLDHHFNQFIVYKNYKREERGMKEHSKCKGQASDGLFPFLRRSGWPHSLVANINRRWPPTGIKIDQAPYEFKYHKLQLFLLINNNVHLSTVHLVPFFPFPLSHIPFSNLLGPLINSLHHRPCLLTFLPLHFFRHAI